MKRKLYSNTKHLTKMFCAGMVFVFMAALVLRVTALRELSNTAAPVVKTVELNSMTIRYNEQIYFQDITARGNMMLESDKNNNCYVSFSIIEPESDLRLYYTKLLQPGKKMNRMPLDNAEDLRLEDGVYDCYLLVQSYDLDQRELMETDEFAVKVYIGQKPSKGKGKAPKPETSASPQSSSEEEDFENDVQDDGIDIIVRD